MAFTKILYFYKVNKLLYLKQYAKFNYFKIYLLQTAVFLLPVVECSLADAHFSANFLNTRTCLGLFDRKGDLCFGKL